MDKITMSREKRPFSEMTDEQSFIIAKLALDNLLQFDTLQALFSHKQQENDWRVEKDIWNKPDKDERPLQVIRWYPVGLGDTHCSIWETDDENHIDVTVYDDKDETATANIVLIVKQLIIWGFV